MKFRPLLRKILARQKFDYIALLYSTSFYTFQYKAYHIFACCLVNNLIDSLYLKSTQTPSDHLLKVTFRMSKNSMLKYHKRSNPFKNHTTPVERRLSEIFHKRYIVIWMQQGRNWHLDRIKFSIGFEYPLQIWTRSNCNCIKQKGYLKTLKKAKEFLNTRLYLLQNDQNADTTFWQLQDNMYWDKSFTFRVGACKLGLTICILSRVDFFFLLKDLFSIKQNNIRNIWGWPISFTLARRKQCETPNNACADQNKWYKPVKK